MKIGLALSGGGAMGAAHIGIIEVLEKNKIIPEIVCGTSAGAIVGLLYSDGGLPAIDKFFVDMEKSGLFSRTNLVLRRNTSTFSKIEELLRHNVKAHHFSELNKKFSCAVTDIVTGEASILSSGDPISSVMASAAYPGVFPVQNIGNHHFVDGGLTKNLPASVAREHGSNFVIGSSLYSVAKFENFDKEGRLKLNLLNVAIRAVDILSKELADQEAVNCDYCFSPPVESFNWYNFEKIPEIRQIGQDYAESKVSDLITKLESVLPHKKDPFWTKLFK